MDFVPLLSWFSGALMGWILALVYVAWLKRRVNNQDAQQVQVKWRILEIHYKDPNRTTEWYRHLRSYEYKSHAKAVADAKRSTDEDTLKNDFRTEYEVVEAP